VGFFYEDIHMKTHYTLLLGSKSYSRKMLLNEAHIPFTVVEQNADESLCDWGLELPKIVENIARYKMEHVVLPDGQQEGDVCFVLTADTLGQDKHGTVHGKPENRTDAIKKIKAGRDGSHLCTAFCLDKKIWQAGVWKTEKRIEQVVHAEYRFCVPDEWIEMYLEKSFGLSASGAIAVEAFGAQFLECVNGSYTAIVGLPMFEVREALQKIDFFEQ
jgi:nucleoside triphosphate pyrophosphatase